MKQHDTRQCIVQLFLSMLILNLSALSWASIDRPDPKKYLNPYSLMTTPEIVSQEDTDWIVVCNQDRAPIFDNIEDQVAASYANYLEIFDVNRREGEYVEVISQDQDGAKIKGWMRMTHLILRSDAIKDDQIEVLYKVFLKIRVSDQDLSKEGLNALRFRNGPGEGMEQSEGELAQGQYHFLTGINEVATAGDLFYFVYGVHFNNGGIDRYQDMEQFAVADYFLIGEVPSLNIPFDADPEEGEPKILGWIPRSGAVLWDTRQALEKIPDRPQENWEAHKFDSRPMLNNYFRLSSQEGKQNFLTKYAKEIVQDHGEGAIGSGQLLRDIVLQVRSGQESDKVISQYIGYPGRLSSRFKFTKKKLERLAGNEDVPDVIVEGLQQLENLEYTDEQEFLAAIGQQIGTKEMRRYREQLLAYALIEQQNFFAQVQEGIQYLELFFLVDATLSMEPCLQAAAQLTGELIQQFDPNYLSVYGAVYRDETEGVQRYEEWDFQRQSPQIKEWFSSQEAFSSSDDTGQYAYLEDVFNAMIMAINGWKNHFTHPFSARFLVILGDAGAHLKPSNPQAEQVIQKLADNMILPFAVQLQHPQSGGQLEQEAMEHFKQQFNHIMQSRYWQQLSPGVKIIPTEDALTGNLRQHVLTIKSTFDQIISNMPQIRRGQKPFCETLCQLGFLLQPELLSGCTKACMEGEEQLQRFLQENAVALADNDQFSLGIALGYLNALKANNPEVWEYLVNRPEVAFSEGFMAVQKDGREMTRPMLLLSRSEIKNIEDTINDIKTRYRDCHHPDTDAKAHQLLIEAVTAILGELLQTNTQNISAENLELWRKTALVFPTKTFVGVDGFLSRMCEEGLWTDFLKQLDQAEKTILNLVAERPYSRLYRDSQNSPYFWVYPEELFPRPIK